MLAFRGLKTVFPLGPKCIYSPLSHRNLVLCNDLRYFGVNGIGPTGILDKVRLFVPGTVVLPGNRHESYLPPRFYYLTLFD